MTIQRPKLVSYARLRHDEVREQYQLVYPEGILELNATGAEILKRCDGRTIDAIIDDLALEFGDCDPAEDVRDFLQRLFERGLLRDAPTPDSPSAGAAL